MDKITLPLTVEEKKSKTKRMFEYWALKNNYDIKKYRNLLFYNNYVEKKTWTSFDAFCAGENFGRGKEF